MRPVAGRRAGEGGGPGVGCEGGPTRGPPELLGPRSRDYARAVRRARVQRKGGGRLVQVALRIRHAGTSQRAADDWSTFPLLFSQWKQLIEAVANRPRSVPDYRTTMEQEYNCAEKSSSCTLSLRPLPAASERQLSLPPRRVAFRPFLISESRLGGSHAMQHKFFFFTVGRGGFARENVLPRC